MRRQSDFENRLLSRLPAADFALVADHLEPVDCPLATVLIEPGVPIADIFFLERGIASIVVLSLDGQMAEGGLVGREGFVTPSIMLGADSTPHKIEMQMGGVGHRISRIHLLDAAAKSNDLRNALLMFTHVAMVQMSYSVLANAVQTVDERLARWLLMCLDRCDTTDLALTHRFIAVMLSVRRSSVTDALHLLESHRFITTDRGCIVVSDRRGLEEYAGDAYGQPEDEYRRLLGPL